MRIKLEWLNELVDLSDISLDKLVDKISLYSIEVETVEKVVSGSKLVVGHVLTKTPHPDSDHLNVLTVDCGDEVRQIVCGASNVDVDQYVIVALIDCVLPGDFKIKKSKIRGVESFGMVCSLAEIGMESKFIPEEYAKGIYYFKEKRTPGEDALKALNFHDSVVELGLTPNRADLMSYLGVAIELSAVFNRPLKPLAFELIESNEKVSDYLSVDVKTDKCLTYLARVVKNVKIKESPRWLSSRLIAFGTRSINNVVDITNYILALFGQPLHAFDYDKLGNKIVVRCANENETVVTLDDVKRNLEVTDICITDGQNIHCLGGVMGGVISEVTDSTVNLVIESAVFDPQTIRKTSSRLGLRSESSQRFERGIDVNRTRLALDYACYLLQVLADGEVVSGVCENGITHIDDKVIEVTPNYINSYLGTNISEAEIIDIFNRLGFSVEKNDNVLKVSVPNRRLDISIKADLVEEVGKLYGYEHLPVTLPVEKINFETNHLGLTHHQANRRKIRHLLCNLGLKEVVTYSLVEAKKNDQFRCHFDSDYEAVKLLMPMTEEHEQMRMNLSSSILDVCKYNYNRKVKDIHIFEIGRVYATYNDKNYEKQMLAICQSGVYSDTLWDRKVEVVDFFSVKGILEEVANKLNVKFDYIQTSDVKQLHPKRTAYVTYNNNVIGYIGQIHPKFAKENDLPQDTYVCEIAIDDILNYDNGIIKYTQISKLPYVERDIAVVCKDNIFASSISKCINETDKSISVKIFDLYKGEKVGNDEKSIAIKLTWEVNETPKEEDITRKVNRVLKKLEEKLGCTLRK